MTEALRCLCEHGCANRTEFGHRCVACGPGPGCRGGLCADPTKPVSPAHLHDPFDPLNHVEWLTTLGHRPMPDGRCEHRWRNRTTQAVNCAFLAGFRAGLSAPERPESEPRDRWWSAGTEGVESWLLNHERHALYFEREHGGVASLRCESCDTHQPDGEPHALFFPRRPSND